MKTISTTMPLIKKMAQTALNDLIKFRSSTASRAQTNTAYGLGDVNQINQAVRQFDIAIKALQQIQNITD
jgi:hypothetical protein